MSLAPILQAGPVIQLHFFFAMPAVFIGTLVLFWMRSGRWHKRLGHVWVVAMAGLALTGFLIPSEFGILGPVGPLHLFSVITLWSLWHGVAAARAGQYDVHKATFEGLWFGGIGVAGLMNFSPGRTVNRMVLGDHWHQGWWVIAIGGVGLAVLWARRNPGVFRIA